MMSICKEVKNNIKKFKNNNLIVAVSGGIDSVVLLYILSKIVDKNNIVVAHFDHDLRKTSKNDKNFVKNLSKNYGFKFVSQKAKNLKNKKGNLEENARDARYNFLLKAAKNNNSKYIVTAHHADDQIETIFMNFKRGSFIEGFLGMDFKTEISSGIYILRPMLNIFKKDIKKYQKNFGLKFTEDKTNKNKNFLRNKIRYDIVFNLKDKDKLELLKNIKFLREKNEENKKDIYNFAKKSIIRECKSAIYLDRSYLVSLSKNIVSEIIKLFLIKLNGSLENVYSKNIFDIVKIIYTKKSGLKIKPLKDISIVCDSDKIIFYKGKIKENKISNQILKIGLNKIKNYNLFLDIFISSKNDKKKFALDFDKIKFPIKLTSYKEGMKIKIKNLGTKKLQDFFVDKKIENRFRKSIPIIVDARGEIIAIIDLIVSESCFSDRKTVKYLLIDIKE